jgi:hypothetical protein
MSQLGEVTTTVLGLVTKNKKLNDNASTVLIGFCARMLILRDCRFILDDVAKDVAHSMGSLRPVDQAVDDQSSDQYYFSGHERGSIAMSWGEDV